jgi:hypothetical protein
MNDLAPSHPEETRVEAVDADNARHAYVERLLAHRVPELSEDEIGRFADLLRTGEDGGMSANWRSNAPAMMIPPELAQRLADVLEAFAGRMDRIEGWLRTEGAA